MSEKFNGCEEELMPVEFVADIDYVGAPTLYELKVKVRAKMEKGWEPIEQNPFQDFNPKNSKGENLLKEGDTCHWVQTMFLVDEE